MKIERLLAITVLLLNRRRVAARELAEKFEVSVRTIYRDIQALNGAGIPVISYQGYEGGLCIPDNYKLSRQLLTFDDMVSILTTLKGVNRTLNNDDIDRVIEKIVALIPDDKEALYRKHSDSFIIDISGWSMGGRHVQTMQFIHAAVSRSVLIVFDYTSADGEESRRTVEPHTLIYKGFNWYLLAFCRLRDDFRLFRLSRIRNYRDESERFLRRKVDPIALVGKQEHRPSVDLVLKFKKKVKIRVEEIFNEDQLQTKPDGTMIATISIPEDKWVLSFLLSFGSEVEVVSPLRWRKAIYKKSKEIKKIYSNLT